MHIVVVGEDETAIRIAETLMAKHDVVFITTSPDCAARLDKLDMQIVEGSGTSSVALREARVGEARFFIAASQNDERNIVACLSAERMGARRSICMLFESRVLQMDEDEDASLAESIGIDAVLRPAELLADEVLQIVTVHGALDVRSFYGGKVRLLKTPVSEGSVLTEAPVGELSLPRGSRLVLRQSDTGGYSVPRAETRLEPGDRLIAVGTRRALRKLLAVARRGDEAHKKVRKAIICGGGTVGFIVAKGLTDSGWEVKLIETDRERCEELAQHLKCMVLYGDGSDIDLLQEERVGEASALIAVTNNDEKNLLISLVAKHLGVPRIITRADRLANERLFEKVGIDVVLSARGAAIRSVTRDIVESDEMQLGELEHGDFRVLELELPDSFSNLTVEALDLPGIASVGAVLRGWRTIVPRDRTLLKPADRVLIICGKDDMEAVRNYVMTAEPPPPPPKAAPAAAPQPDDGP